MATSWGVGPDQNGNGHTTEDAQLITAAEYENPGILAGCKVVGTTGKNWKVEPGAVVIALDPTHYLKTPVGDSVVPMPDPPAVGSKTYSIYVKQKFPATDGSNTVFVGAADKVPANSVEIGKRIVPAGATSANDTIPAGNTIYARAKGATLGMLAESTDVGGDIRGGAEYKKGAVTVEVPTDRFVELSLSSCVSTANSESGEGSLLYSFYLDGQLVTSWERKYDKYWETKQFFTGLQIDNPFIVHTVHYTVQRISGSKDWVVRYGGERKMRGDFLAITDRGVWKG